MLNRGQLNMIMIPVRVRVEGHFLVEMSSLVLFHSAGVFTRVSDAPAVGMLLETNATPLIHSSTGVFITDRVARDDAEPFAMCTQ